jgi:DNA-binding response OmpR family regulator
MLPPFLLLEDSYSDVQAMTALLKRIGLVNRVRVIGSVADAQQYLLECAPSRLPVLALIGSQVRGAHGLDLLTWMREQEEPIAKIAAIALIDGGNEDLVARTAMLGIAAVEKPVEMRALITAMKALALPEKAKIDVSTLTVQVELWPYGTAIDS